MASISPLSATTVVYFFKDSNNVIVISYYSGLTAWNSFAQATVLLFELSDLGQTATMSACTAEAGAQEVRRAVPGNRDACGPASEAEYI
jgi:hypothetical protein